MAPPIDDLPDVAIVAGYDHAIGIYDTDAFLVQAVVTFIRPALEQHAIAVAVLPGATLGEVELQLRADGVDTEAAKLGGEYLAIDAQALYAELMAQGRLDLREYQAKIDELLSTAADRGCDVYLTGNLHSLFWEAGEIAALLELEGLWNRGADGPKVRALCMYSSGAFEDAGRDDLFIDLCQSHGCVAPVESYESLVGSDEGRAISLLEHHEDSERIHEHIRSELDRCIEQADEQTEQFGRAIASRDVIGQAKGIVMVRWRVDADVAFSMLRDASNRSNRKLAAVAEAVVQQQLRRN